jgi:hypothetical protein
MLLLKGLYYIQFNTTRRLLNPTVPSKANRKQLRRDQQHRQHRQDRQHQQHQQHQQKIKTTETLSVTIAASSKATDTSLNPNSEQAKVNTDENGATTQVDIAMSQNLHYMIFCFQMNDDPNQPNPCR